jgi:hypothetical protein
MNLIVRDEAIIHDIYPNRDTEDMLGTKCKWTHTHLQGQYVHDVCKLYNDRYMARPNPRCNRKFVLPKFRYQWFTSVSLDPAWNNISYLTLYTNFSMWARIFLNVKYIVFPWTFFYAYLLSISVFVSHAQVMSTLLPFT